MKDAVFQMIERSAPQSLDEYNTVLKEIIQRICLLGLWRARFFEHCAFYGDTALRLLYDLDRFSEDLDFSLLQPDLEFRLQPYFHAVHRELTGFGFEAEISGKNRPEDSTVAAAFVKANTRLHFLQIGVPDHVTRNVPGNQLLKVKFEIDTDPPPDFDTEVRYILQPVPFSVRMFAPEDLLAGKMHALLCRRWKHRVKGRDWYDLVWFVGKEIPLHVAHLEARMRQTGDWSGEAPLTESDAGQRLHQAIHDLDIEAAKKDVSPFLRDKSQLELWSHDFFRTIAEMIRFV